MLGGIEMATVDIFGSIDADGLLEKYNQNLIAKYGTDPTVSNPGEELRQKITSYAKTNLLVVGGGDSPDLSELRKYVRFVSSKRSTLGYELRDQDIVTEGGKKYLAYTYNLSIGANNGDKLRWWGHTINPNSRLQTLISNITRIGQGAPPPEFTQFKKSNTNFYFVSSADNPSDLTDGFNCETQNVFCITTILNSTAGKTISYNIELMVLSAAFENNEGKRLSYPIMKVVVDPTIIVRG
jgi:hypothetical protein